MRIAIAEDRPDDSSRLVSDLLKWAADNNIPLTPPPALYESGEALLKHFSPEKYDVIFLDIFMGDINGLETARYIRETDRMCRLVFITTTPEFAVDSYDVDSSWYLLKPYSYDKLSQALARCGADFLEQNQYLSIPGKQSEQKLLLHQIVWTEYINRQICIHLENGKEVYTRMRQSDFADLLLAYPYFCDCIKGILVNLEFIEKLDEHCFLLRNGQILPISRLKYRNVREKYLDYSYAKLRNQSSPK